MSFLSRRRPPYESDERTSYDSALQAWQLRNGLDRHDLSPAQARRRRLHSLTLNAGLDASHVAFAQWLVDSGKMDDDDTDTAPCGATACQGHVVGSEG